MYDDWWDRRLDCQQKICTLWCIVQIEGGGGYVIVVLRPNWTRKVRVHGGFSYNYIVEAYIKLVETLLRLYAGKISLHDPPKTFFENFHYLLKKWQTALCLQKTIPATTLAYSSMRNEEWGIWKWGISREENWREKVRSKIKHFGSLWRRKW